MAAPAVPNAPPPFDATDAPPMTPPDAVETNPPSPAPSTSPAPNPKLQPSSSSDSVVSWGWIAVAIVVAFGAVVLALTALLTDPTASWRRVEDWGNDIYLDATMHANRVDADAIDASQIDLTTLRATTVQADAILTKQPILAPRGIRSTYLRLGGLATQTWVGPTGPATVEAHVLPLTELDASFDAKTTLEYVPPAPLLLTTDLLDTPYGVAPPAPVAGYVWLHTAGVYRVHWRAVLRGTFPPLPALNVVAALAAGPQPDVQSNMRKAAQTRMLPWIRPSVTVHPLLANDVDAPVADTHEIVIELSAAVKAAADTALIPLVFRADTSGPIGIYTPETELRVEYAGPN